MTTSALPLPQRTSYAPLWISFMVAIAYGLPMGILNVAWAQISADLAQPYDRLGILLTAGLIGRMSMTLFGGQILARLGVWTCMLIGLTGMVAGFGLYFTASSWEMLLAAALIAALGNGVMDIGLTLIVVSRYRAGTLNWMHAAFGVGLIVGPLLLTAVNTWGWGWRAAYLLPMSVAAAALIASFITRAEWMLPAARNDDGSEATGRGASLIETLRLGRVWLWLAVAFIYGGIEVGIGQLAGDMLIHERGVDPVTASAWISLYWGSFTLGRMVTSFLTRIPQHTLMRAYAVGTVVGALVLFIPNPGAALIGLLILGFAMAGFFPAQLTAVPGRVGFRHAANATGFTISSVSIGLTVLPGLGASLAVSFGFSVVPPFVLAMTVALAVLMFIMRGQSKAS